MNDKNRKLTPLKIASLYLVCVALVLFFQLLNLWSDGTPVEFNLMTLVVAPLIFMAVMVLYGLLWRFIQRRMTPLGSPFLIVYLKYTLFFLVVFLASDVVNALLSDDWSSISILSTLITVPLVSLLLTAADPEGERKKLADANADADVSSSTPS